MVAAFVAAKAKAWVVATCPTKTEAMAATVAVAMDRAKQSAAKSRRAMMPAAEATVAAEEVTAARTVTTRD